MPVERKDGSSMKRMITAVAVPVLAAVLAGSAAARVSASATLLIHHQTKGCHAWALNGSSAYKVSQVIHLAKGGALTVTNNDVMAHQLIKTAGPAVKIKLTNPGTANIGKLKPPYATGLMPHMGATVKVTFTKAGVYKLTTKEGDDYYPGIKTIGADNILRATVVVS
jgi:hypothetical protein